MRSTFGVAKFLVRLLQAVTAFQVAIQRFRERRRTLAVVERIRSDVGDMPADQLYQNDGYRRDE